MVLIFQQIHKLSRFSLPTAHSLWGVQRSRAAFGKHSSETHLSERHLASFLVAKVGSRRLTLSNRMCNMGALLPSINIHRIASYHQTFQFLSYFMRKLPKFPFLILNGPSLRHWRFLFCVLRGSFGKARLDFGFVVSLNTSPCLCKRFSHELRQTIGR